jgi:aspartokinase/homoserine dehydrogenase 1
MRIIIQLTTDLFQKEKACQKTIEEVKKRHPEQTFVVCPAQYVAQLTASVEETHPLLPIKGYIAGEGKEKAARWAVEVKADAVEHWTIVKGLYTADPRKVASAKIIRALDYQDAMELASAGTGLLDRKALHLLAASSIPLHIRSVFHLEKEGGTTIDAFGSKHRVKALSAESNVALVSLSGMAFQGVAGIDARAFGALYEEGISVKLVSQASSERSLGLVVDQAVSHRAKNALQKAFTSDEDTLVKVLEGLTILNIVGRHNYALERSIYELRRNNIWMHLIANSVEGHQISLVIDGSQERKAMELVHNQLLGQLKRLNVFCFGKGLVGGTFIRQVLESSEYVRNKRKLDIRLIGVADSKQAYFQAEGISEDWRAQLENSPLSNDPDGVIAWLSTSGLSNLVIVDNTADQRLTDSYPSFVKAGCDLVASNKKGNAREQAFYDDLRFLLHRKGKQFKYETNVGAGLPLIDTLIQLHHSSDRITRIKGVFSGSMSYLFNTFCATDRAFTDILEEAQQRGYTEPDPREDLNGMDVARKLLILARTVDARAEMAEVEIENLIPEQLRSIAHFQDFKAQFSVLDEHYGRLKSSLDAGEVLRFVGDMQLSASGEAALTVSLIRVPKGSPMGGVQRSDSLFEIFTEGYGDHPFVIQGAGAGAEVTARGVFSDVLRLG